MRIRYGIIWGGWMVLMAVSSLAASKEPKTPEAAFQALSGTVNGKPPSSRIQYVSGKRPFVIVTLAQYSLGELIKARTPSGMVYARSFDRHLSDPEGGTAVMAQWGIVVNAPKNLRVVLHAPFTASGLSLNGKSAYDDNWRLTVRAKWKNYRGGPQMILAQYGTIILPGGRTVLEFFIE